MQRVVRHPALGDVESARGECVVPDRLVYRAAAGVQISVAVRLLARGELFNDVVDALLRPRLRVARLLRVQERKSREVVTERMAGYLRALPAPVAVGLLRKLRLLAEPGEESVRAHRVQKVLAVGFVRAAERTLAERNVLRRERTRLFGDLRRPAKRRRGAEERERGHAKGKTAVDPFHTHIIAFTPAARHRPFGGAHAALPPHELVEVGRVRGIGGD